MHFIYCDFLAWDIWSEKDEKEDVKLIHENIEPDIKKFYGSLKDRYQKRYDGQLDGRFEITLEVNEDWKVDKPKTYKFDAKAKISPAFEAVKNAFDNKGRLLIVGSPGSGKTVLLLKLALELLGDECQKEQKLPVIFNLASWSEEYNNFEDWLIDGLNSGNGLSKEFAKILLQQNRIILLLDGLDELARKKAVEIAVEKRAKCLNSLNDYLRMGRKVVICCRREEFAEMQKATNTDAPVSAQVEVLNLTKAEIILALQHTQNQNESNASATNLLKIIETNNDLLGVLATPFYFTTSLEVFDIEILKEKDFPIDEAGIKEYLLDKFIENKLKHTSKLTEFENNNEKILKWFKWLAYGMNRNQLVIFELTMLQPSLLKSKIYFKFILGPIEG